MKVKVKGYELEKDEKTGIVLSTDIDGYRAALLRKKIAAKKNEEIKTLNDKVDKLTSIVEKLIEKMDK